MLEVPAAPASQGGKDASAMPQLAPQQGPELELPSRALRSQSGYEQLTVTVTDQGGRYVTGLQKGDFRIYVDGIQRPLEFLRRDINTPVSIGILVDTSGSMEPKIPQARAAIAQFIRDLNPDDDIFLYAFSDQQFLLQPFTINHDLVMRRLGLLHAYGDTAIFDTIIDGLYTISRGRYDKKALLVVTDGMDNASRATLAQVVGRARRMGVLIYSIGIGDPNSSKIGFGIGPLLFGGIGITSTRRCCASCRASPARAPTCCAKSATVNCCARIAPRSATSCASSTPRASWCRIPRWPVIAACAWTSQVGPSLRCARAKA